MPTGAQTDVACNETKHLADVFPLSRWLPCAAGLFADGGGNGTVVFLTTDAPAVYRYAERHGAAAVAPATLVMLPGGERAIGHTGARPERPRRKGAAPTPIDSHPDPHAVFARGAADWTLLSLCDAMLGPVQSFFARSACEARAMEPSCHVFEPLKQMNQKASKSHRRRSARARSPAASRARCSSRRTRRASARAARGTTSTWAVASGGVLWWSPTVA